MCGGVVCTDVAAAYPYTAEKFKSGQTSLSAAIIVHPQNPKTPRKRIENYNKMNKALILAALSAVSDHQLTRIRSVSRLPLTTLKKESKKPNNISKESMAKASLVFSMNMGNSHQMHSKLLESDLLITLR